LNQNNNKDQTFVEKIIDIIEHNQFGQCNLTVDFERQELDVQMRNERPELNNKKVLV